MFRACVGCVALVALATLGGQARAAGPQVQINGTFPGVVLKAYAQGTPLTGAGLFGNPNSPYVLRVTSGAIIAGRYASLAGTITSGAFTTTFRLDAESTTGTIRFTYATPRGPVTLTTVGVVTITGP